MAWVASLPMSCNIVRKITSMIMPHNYAYATTACGAVIFTFPQGFQSVQILICDIGVGEQRKF